MTGALLAAGALLLAGAPAAAGEPALPPVLMKAAARWKVDPADVTVSLTALEGAGVIAPDGRRTDAKPVFAWHADRPAAPASTAKLVTTLAGLELLGGAWRWSTGIYADARPDAKGRVGTLYIRGGGDPTLVVEKFALLLDRLAQLGLRHIAGDIVVDRSYFDIPKGDPAAFDGRRNRPYNQLPDAALVNWRNLSFDFVPDPAAGRARIVTVPRLAGVRVPASVPLKKKGGCGDWKTAIGYRLTAAADGTKTVKFDGAFPAACGEKNFNVVALPADEYLERLIRALWVKEGRTWKGRIVQGRVPDKAERLAVHFSPALPEVTALVNKWSNNQIARHIFLTLGTVRVKAEAEAGQHDGGEPSRPGRGVTLEDARSVLAEWLAGKGIDPRSIRIDNGSGLSRETRATAAAMTDLLAAGWTSPYRHEFAASLPMSGVDGTMSRRKIAVERAHLKTGFLSDVRSVGGYVYAADGRWYALYASVLGEKNMPGGIAFLNSVIEWAYERPAAAP